MISDPTNTTKEPHVDFSIHYTCYLSCIRAWWSLIQSETHSQSLRTWADNKVCQLATVCMPWQHWTKALVWFDDDISPFHSCVVVDLWQSLSEWHLLLSACVLVCRREAKKSHNLPRPFGGKRWHFGPCHYRWWDMGLPIRPWNEAAKCTMEDCQFPHDQKSSVSPNEESKQCCWLFLILEVLFIINLYQLEKQ